jgi:hypothetical protein
MTKVHFLSLLLSAMPPAGNPLPLHFSGFRTTRTRALD